MFRRIIHFRPYLIATFLVVFLMSAVWFVVALLVDNVILLVASGSCCLASGLALWYVSTRPAHYFTDDRGMKIVAVVPRGPALVFILTACVAVGLEIQRGTTAKKTTHEPSSTPIVTRRSTPMQTEIRRTPARRPRTPGPRLTTIPTWNVVASRGPTSDDPATGVRLQVRDVQGLTTQSGRTISGHIWLALQVRLTTGKHAALYSQHDFFAIDDSGQAYPSVLLDAGHPALGTGQIRADDATHGWIAFDLPARRSTGTVIWNDDNRLIPPPAVLRYRVREH